MTTYIAVQRKGKLEPLPQSAEIFGNILLKRIADPTHRTEGIYLLERFIRHWEEVQPGNYDLGRYKSYLDEYTAKR